MSDELPSAFFVTKDGGDVLEATAATRGPWSDDHQHGGPTAALLARAIVRAFTDDTSRVARFAVAFHKPIPIAAFRIALEAVREGKKVKVVRARLLAADATSDTKPIATAEATVVRRASVAAQGPAMEIHGSDDRPPETSPPFAFPFFRGAVGYHRAMETRTMHGRFGEGRMGVWMRMRIPLVDDETPGPLERTVCAADSGNGISVGVDVERFTFLNPDLTTVLARVPEGEWIGIDAATTFGDDGIGLADARLVDARGVFGRSVQSLILEPRP